jgi:hypothetical protein
MQRAIKVKVIKESPTTVTIQFVSSNSSMPVGKDDFDQRVKDGVYEVIE